MKAFKFYGASDDLFEMDGPLSEEQCDCGNGRVMAYHLKAAGGELIVAAVYAPDVFPDGTWLVGVSPATEDTPIPDWPTRFETGPHATSHSATLVIECPDDVTIDIIEETE
jgi:hypothetical protein